MPRIALALLFTFSLAAQPAHLLLRKPALSRTQIVFSFSGDLWSVPREGGEARRLTAGPGVETDPVFSPDDSQIAFTGEYDGNVDVFVMPAAGGVPKRLTWHPRADTAVGWSPDGKRILFCSSRTVPYDGARLYTVSAAGGAAEEIPLPIALEASYSPDASHLAYVPLFQWQEAWKRYRGGQEKKIWIADLADSSIVEIPRQNSNDFNPMWVGDRIYFLSDRTGPVTLFFYDVKTRQVRQAVENHGLDFKSASAGPGAIVYEQFGSLGLYDLKTGQARPVEVKLAGDLPEVRPHFVKVSGRLHSADLSPTGARAVFEARGEILTVPADKGEARNLTNTTAINERSPAWSPDGQSIAYFSDESGEYMLHIRDQNGMGEVKKIALGEKSNFYYRMQWSPDGKKIAYNDCHSRIFYIDLEDKKPVQVEADYYAAGPDFMATWSPDSKWLAYAKDLKSHMSAIYLYSLAEKKATQVTDGMSEARSPVFDKDGKYLYFMASTNSGPAMQPDVESFRDPVSFSVYLVVLAKDYPSPFAPESDDEKKKDDGKKDDGKKDDGAVKVDFDNIGQRILSVPLPARRYGGLVAGKAGLLYAVQVGAPVPGADQRATVHRCDLNKRKVDVAVGGVRAFDVSFNGEKMLYLKDDGWKIASAIDGSDEKTLRTGDLEVRVDPTAEWKQMFHETWRIERDFFYDPHYHGLDLKAAEERYGVYLDGLASREDLNYLFKEMLGNMTVGHMFVGGGDKPDVTHVSTGLLGADYKIVNGRYRFARIYNGENWNPDLKAPLTQPGVNVRVGEYLLAVNGRELRGTDDIYSFFEETAGKPVVIKVGFWPDDTGGNPREVTVVPIEDEFHLRHLAWIEDNRRKVDEMTNGRVAYVHMPDTAYGGYTAFMRYFFAQVGKDAVIIDDRFNHGGELATDVIEYLQRRLMSVATFRDGEDSMQPQGAIFGPKVMIINQFAGSGGDAMPWYFHRAGVGKLVGMRTWGGLVGLTGYPELMDGGVVMAPSAAIWNPNGTYDVENHGVSPDIEVDLEPAAVRKGHDPQLEKAVQVVMEELAKDPKPELKRPAYPTYKQ
ncbi:MAG TPA: PDZ domain-containing protein [Bryobacteraceae bacterium]|nr:PDZ domain-containing protein [Bryobacteraceae bacterium]